MSILQQEAPPAVPYMLVSVPPNREPWNLEPKVATFIRLNQLLGSVAIRQYSCTVVISFSKSSELTGLLI